MRRLRRILLNALTMLSLLLFAAAVGLWVRSYWRTDQLMWVRATDQPWTHRGYRVFSEGGGVYVTPVTFYGEPQFWESSDRRELDSWERAVGEQVRRARPVRYLRIPGPLPDRFWFVVVADWFVVLLFAALPGYRIFGRLRRHPPGLCPTCGYDLRATPERCPECGAVPDRAES